MLREGRIIDEKHLYVMCPKCGIIRQKNKGKFNIIKRGRERNGIARFLCSECRKWFNEKTGESMQWQYRS